MITYMIASIFAIYLYFRCNQKFNLLSLLAAIIFPHFYVGYVLFVENGCINYETILPPLREINH